MELLTNNSIKCTIALADLYNVYDPEIGLNVVDLKLIYQIDIIEDEKRIEASMTLTTQFARWVKALQMAYHYRLPMPSKIIR